MKITEIELWKKIVEVEETALNLSHGYVGLTPDLDVWTYSSEPNPNSCLCGLFGNQTKERDTEWKEMTFGYILECIQCGEYPDLKIVKNR